MKNPLKFLFPVPGLLLEITRLLIRQENTLADLTLKLNQLGKKMSTIEEYTARIQAAAETIKGNTSLLDSIVQVQGKIFDEVRALKAQNLSTEAFDAALNNLEAATNAEVASTASAIALNTKIDELNPDFAIDANGVLVDNSAI